MSKHILSVCYDPMLLSTRQLVLEHEGYRVTSALGLEDGIAKCNGCGFDLFILGHSIPVKEKERLVSRFRLHGDAPVLSLLRAGESEIAADFYIYPDRPEEFLRMVALIFQPKIAIVPLRDRSHAA